MAGYSNSPTYKAIIIIVILHHKARKKFLNPF